MRQKRAASACAPARPTLGPAALYRAQCATCGAHYPGHWRLVPGQRRTF